MEKGIKNVRKTGIFCKELLWVKWNILLGYRINIIRYN